MRVPRLPLDEAIATLLLVPAQRRREARVRALAARARRRMMPLVAAALDTSLFAQRLALVDRADAWLWSAFEYCAAPRGPGAVHVRYDVLCNALARAPASARLAAPARAFMRHYRDDEPH